jgi:hypothetical protein
VGAVFLPKAKNRDCQAILARPNYCDNEEKEMGGSNGERLQ